MLNSYIDYPGINQVDARLMIGMVDKLPVEDTKFRKAPDHQKSEVNQSVE